ncbi:MAG: hypothetical protein GX610_08550 [Rhodococcus sp.]|nr:hypothetical protein [Rhodococcus sp. (in: high G+C Gram-positive bacteria)]
MSDSSAGAASPSAARPALRVLVYSDDKTVRSSLVSGLGTRLDSRIPDLEYLEVATAPMVNRHLDAGGVDLAILDGEAVPAGGMGVAKQLRDEIEPCPPLLVITGRADDAWLASWSRADVVLSRPVDPIHLAQVVVDLLLPSVSG